MSYTTAMFAVLTILIVVMSLFEVSLGFSTRFPSSYQTKSSIVMKSEPKLGGNVATRGLFAVTELLRGLLGSPTRQGNSMNKSNNKSKSLQAVAELIRKDYEKIFWVTGNMDLSLWADNCTFSDPFSSFGGAGSAKRFKKNADSLGKLVDQPRMRMTSFAIDKDLSIVTVGWSFSSNLKLPWYPVLAAAGETLHYLDQDSKLIVKYEEKWKSKPLEVVLRLIKPGKRV